MGQGDRALVPKNVTNALDMLMVMFFGTRDQSPQSHFLILANGAERNGGFAVTVSILGTGGQGPRSIAELCW